MATTHRLPPAAAARIRYITLDVADLDRAARFWTALLGVGVHARDRQYVWLERAEPAQPSIALQRVAEPKTAKNRCHVDLVSDDPEATLAAVELLGGRVIEEVVDPLYELVVAADPDGNEFCVIRAGSEQRRDAASA
jgi:predicted enzyme related to lactoylglutathione lyase